MYKRNFLVMAKLHVVLRKFENSEINARSCVGKLEIVVVSVFQTKRIFWGIGKIEGLTYDTGCDTFESTRQKT